MRQKILSKFVESRSMNFCKTGITKLSLIGKNVLILMVLILINKELFEPNDLKFTSETTTTFSPT